MYVIETRGLAKAYHGRRVVDDFAMHVQPGDIYGFVGKNGAGKSTVMKMVDGLVQPTAGEVLLFGVQAEAGMVEPVATAPAPPTAQTPSGAPSAQVEPSAASVQAAAPAAPSATDRARSRAQERLGGRGASLDGRQRIGVLIEAPGLLPALSAFDNLMAKALALGLPDARERCEEALRLVGLEAAGRKRAKRFSQGMKQRLGIALALIGQPDLLLLDEPFNGLDPEGTRAMRQLLMRLNQSFGMTMVISSHVLDQLDRMATRYGVIAQGRMVREMTAEAVRAECGDSLRVRTADPARTLALLEQAFPAATLRMEPDQALHVSGGFEPEAVAQRLHADGVTVLEFTEVKRDLEDYFVELMEGGSHVQPA